MSQNNISDLDSKLNQLILGGQILDAFEQFYADDVSMQEGVQEPRVGKAANREYEEQFVNAIAEVHGIELLGAAVDGDRSYSEWLFDVTFKDGSRVKNNQVAARTWRDGQVVNERFYAPPS